MYTLHSSLLWYSSPASPTGGRVAFGLLPWARVCERACVSLSPFDTHPTSPHSSIANPLLCQFGRPPLFTAALKGKADNFAALLDLGANPLAQDKVRLCAKDSHFLTRVCLAYQSRPGSCGTLANTVHIPWVSPLHTTHLFRPHAHAHPVQAGNTFERYARLSGVPERKAGVQEAAGKEKLVLDMIT